MSSRLYILLSALVGIATGFVTIHSFFEHSWTSMILWVALGLVVVYFSKDRKSAMYAGASFGFCTIFFWLIAGFGGSLSQVRGFALLLILLSIFGALCGSVGALLFFRFLRR